MNVCQSYQGVALLEAPADWDIFAEDPNPCVTPPYMKVEAMLDSAKPTAEPAELTDEELLVRYRDTGERLWFDELVHRYERDLFNYLRRYLGSPEAAEDVFQATFLKLHLSCEHYEEGRKFRPWLYTIATNQAIDFQRRNRRHKMVSLDRPGSRQADEEVGKLIDMLVTGEETPWEAASSREETDWVRQALLNLPEPMRAALNLVYYQGLMYREAAEVLEVPVGTVKSRVNAAILKLVEAWKSRHQSRD